MKIVSNNIDNNNNAKRKLYTIQYTKEELDEITLDFVTQMNNYIIRANDRIIKTLEEIEKEAGIGEEEVEIVPATTTTIKGQE